MINVLPPFYGSQCMFFLAVTDMLALFLYSLIIFFNNNFVKPWGVGTPRHPGVAISLTLNRLYMIINNN